MERRVLKHASSLRAFPQSLVALGLAALLSACAIPSGPEPNRGGENAAGGSMTPSASRPGANISANGRMAPPGEGSPDSIHDYPPVPAVEPAFEKVPQYADLWARIGDGLQLREYYQRPEVRQQMRLYANRPDYFEQVGERARPFLHNIVQQIEQRGMPMEIALMPFVESGFNPHAVSTAAAVGPWQFLAGTARGLGLRVDAWFDGRRDPVQATTAALDYLEIQHERFAGNWLLAFAAYNSGPANVGRSLRALGEDAAGVDFWRLPLPAETQVHVPRILALASILDQGREGGFAFPEIANEEALARVKVGQSASIVLAAGIAGVEPERLRALNPGFRQWWTPPDGGPDFLHLPIANAEALRRALIADPLAIQVRAERYRIQPGDTLGGIAQAMAVPVELLRSRNGLSGDLIVAGEYLWVPGLDGTDTENADGADPLALAGDMAVAGGEAAAAPRLHTVQPGDSLWAIARRHRLAVDDLARNNGIAPGDIILPGQQLLLNEAPLIGNSAGSGIHRVRRGDTLGRIANRAGVPLAELLGWNALSGNETIFPGQIIRISPPGDNRRD